VKLFQKIEEMNSLKQRITETIETPMSEVIDSIQELMNGNYGKDQYKIALSKILKSLGQSNLYKPAFVDIQLEDMEEDTRNWLSSQFTTDETSIMKTRRTSLPKISEESLSITKIPFDLKTYKPSVDLKVLHFDATSFSSTELKKMVCWMFKDLNFFSTYKLNEHKFWTMMGVLEKSYKDNIYHNFNHAIDVTQYIFMIISNEKVNLFLNDFDKFVLMVSALFHDINHPGFNNIYLINTRDDLALLYNDISVLENYHAYTAFNILSNPSTSIIEHLTNEQYQEFRKNFIKVILSTDMSQHFTIVTKFQTRIEASPLLKDNELDRIDLMKIIMKCADISNITRPFTIARKWAKNCVNEFFCQGDMEKEKDLPVGILNDRNNLNFPKSQMGFVDFVAGGLFRNLLMAFPELKTTYDTIEENKSFYKYLFENEIFSIKDETDFEKLKEMKAKQDESKVVEEEKKEIKVEEEVKIAIDPNYKKFIFDFYVNNGRSPYIKELCNHFNTNEETVLSEIKRECIQQQLLFDQSMNQIMICLPFCHFPTTHKMICDSAEICYSLSVFDLIGSHFILNKKINIESQCFQTNEKVSFTVEDGKIGKDSDFNFYLNSPFKKWMNSEIHCDSIVVSKSDIEGKTKLEFSQVIKLAQFFYQNYFSNDFKFPSLESLNDQLQQLNLQSLIE
jgi:hypothetical protein